MKKNKGINLFALTILSILIIAFIFMCIYYANKKNEVIKTVNKNINYVSEASYIKIPIKTNYIDNLNTLRTFNLHVPEINLDSSDVSLINASIRYIYNTSYDYYNECCNSNECYIELNYSYQIKNNILSIILVQNKNGINFVYTYNVDLLYKRPIYINELLGKYNITYEEFISTSVCDDDISNISLYIDENNQLNSTYYCGYNNDIHYMKLQ